MEGGGGGGGPDLYAVFLSIDQDVRSLYQKVI